MYWTASVQIWPDAICEDEIACVVQPNLLNNVH